MSLYFSFMKRIMDTMNLWRRTMSARNSAKAVVINNGKLLVNRCRSRVGDYYTLPGGGQRTGEMLPETVRRELLEETGYSVTPIRLSGIYERLSGSRDDGQNHKIYFIFLCRLDSGERKQPRRPIAIRRASNGSPSRRFPRATSSPAPSATTSEA